MNIWYVALFFITLGPAYGFADDCESDAVNSIYEQSKKLDCEVRKVAEKIRSGNAIVPKAIYHFGKRKLLDEDIAAGNIPQQAWDEFIMGGKTRYELAENRRGLYGSVGIDQNDFGGGEFDALMEIRIKDSCRSPENVVSMTDLPQSDRFKKWFGLLPAKKKVFNTVSSFENRCFREGDPITDYRGTFGPKQDCADFVSAYLNDSKAKVIQDFAISKSFYIRDRTCIESLRGTPKEIIEIASRNDLLFLAPCGNSGVKDFARIIYRSLVEEKVDPAAPVLQKIGANLKLAGQDSQMLESYRKCAQTGHLDRFNESIKQDKYYLVPPDCN